MHRYTIHWKKSTFAVTVHWIVTAILQNAWKHKKNKIKKKGTKRSLETQTWNPNTHKMQWKLNLTWVICLWMRKTTEAIPHGVIFRSQLPRIYYYQSQVVTSIRNLSKPFGLSQNTNLQLNPYPNTQLDLYCSGNLPTQYMNLSTWLTNDARIPVRE